MIERLPRLPFSLDPLIAAAKRRMRRRRMLVAVVVVALVGGSAGAAIALSGQSSAASRGLAPTGPAVRLAMCSVLHNGSGCHSPDGAWSVLISSDGLSCSVLLRHGTGLRKTAYHSTHRGCEQAVWVKPHRLLFGVSGPGSPSRVLSLDPTSRKVTLVGNFLGFVVSANERWLAGELRPRGGPPLVTAVSLGSNRCEVVTQAHGPNENLLIAPGPGVGTLGREGVTWRRLPGKVKVNEAVGPGVGFTRDSKGLIVAIDRWRKTFASYHRSLEQFSLTSRHPSCPAVATSGSADAGAFAPLPYPRFPRQVEFPLTTNIHRSGSRIDSIKVTVNGPVHNAVMEIVVLRGNPFGKSGPAPNHPAVFTERVRMTNLPGHGDFPAGSFPLAAWTGTLSPTDWKGGCRPAQYEIYLRIRPAKPSRFPQGEDLGSPWFRCIHP